MELRRSQLAKMVSCFAAVAIACCTAESALAKTRPTPPAATYSPEVEKIQALITQKRLPEAIRLIRPLLQQHPESADLWVALAYYQYHLPETSDKNLALARQYANKALALDPELGWAYCVEAELDNFQGNWESAIKNATKAVTVKRPDCTGYRYRALSENAVHHYKEALDDINKFMEVAHRKVYGLSDKASILMNLGRYQEAADIYEVLMKDKIADTYIYAQVRCYTKSGRDDQAIDALSRLIKVNPGDDAAYRARAKLYSASGRFDAAIADLSKSIAVLPSSTVYKERAELYKKTKRMDLYSKDLESAAKL